jgi:O-glycosyl hydrolase
MLIARALRAGAATLIAAGCGLASGPAVLAAQPARHAAGATDITVDGTRRGPTFAGVGAISGGGGMARLLIDYPAKQRTQILNYLFGPGGADLQMLKLEIGGDSASADGAEPSIESREGQLDCDSGYEWWLAEQAVARDPRIVLLGLQWGAPGWVGNVWNGDDIGYVIDWLNCAKSHGLTIGYLGGWNENGYNIPWYEKLRKALNADGYGSVKIIAADSFPGPFYVWARTFNVAKAAAADPAFKAVLNVIGVHDTCHHPTSGYQCESTKQARQLGLPLWESELGSLQGDSAAADLARAINNGYIQADMTGFLQWPVLSAVPEGMPYDHRGLVTAQEPQSGFYYVDRLAWATAQTTQFTEPGWRYITGASGPIGDSGSYVSYESPDHADWSLVAENAGGHRGQAVGARTITVHLRGGLARRNIAVWTTDSWSSKPAYWFVRQPDVHPSDGTFSYTIKPGYLVSFTSTTGQAHLRYASPPPAPMRLPYSAAADASNQAWGLATQEGAFLYEPCLGGVSGSCLEQLASQVPIFWQKPKTGTPNPYAVVGSDTWTNYTVSASVLLTTDASSAGLIGRFSNQVIYAKHFDGYEFDLSGDGRWQLVLNAVATSKVLASGAISGDLLNNWHVLELSLRGSRITALIDGQNVASVTNSAYSAGLTGIESSWTPVQFGSLTVR